MIFIKQSCLKKLFFFFVCVSIFLFCQFCFALTLRQTVDHTVHTNPDVLLSTHVRGASKEEVGVARSGFLPTLDLNAGLGPEQTESSSTQFVVTKLGRSEFGLNLRQMLFDAFGTWNELQRTKYKAVADAYAVSGTSNDQAILAIEAYLDILQNRKLVVIAKNNLARIRRIYQLVKLKHDAGLSRKADLYQAISRLQLARANLFSLQNDLIDSMTAFKKVTGLTPTRLSLPKSISMRLLPKTLHAAIQQGLDANPKLRAALADVSEAEYQYRSSKSVNFPRIDMAIGYNRDKNIDGVKGPDNSAFILFELNYNLFRGGGDISKQHENAYKVAQSADIRNQTLRELLETTRLSWDSIVAANMRIPALSARQKAASGTVRLYKEQFKLGRRTLLDLLDSENELFNARLSYTKEQFLLRISKYRLLAVMNKLLSYLHVTLPRSALPPYKEKLSLPKVFPDPGVLSADRKYTTAVQEAEVKSSYSKVVHRKTQGFPSMMAHPKLHRTSM